MKTGQRYPDDADETIRQMRADGFSIDEVARRYGRTPSAIKHRIATRKLNPRGKRSRFWTPERTERLSELWCAGTKIKSIAKELETTKNAVIGKAARLKLPTHAGASRGRKRKHPWDLLDEPLSWPPATDTGAIEALQDRQCRWPSGDPYSNFSYCKLTRVGRSSYCKLHQMKNSTK
jgi:GcrA cell cycle regulator